MKIEIVGRVRQPEQGFGQRSPGDEEIIALTEQGGLFVGLDGSAYEETVRLGRSFEIHTVAAIAAVVARPTTAHMLAIWNGEPDDGRIYVIDRAWALNEVSTAVASQAVLLGCLGQIREAAPTDAARTISALNGMSGRDTKARSLLNATALPATTGIADNWRVLPCVGGVKTGAAATPGYYVNAPVDGRIILPPGRFFAVHVMANVVGETFTCGIEWHEKNAKLT